MFPDDEVDKRSYQSEEAIRGEDEKEVTQSQKDFQKVQEIDTQIREKFNLEGFETEIITDK